MKRVLLEGIVNGTVKSDTDVQKYVESTLLHHQYLDEPEIVAETVESAVDFLTGGSFIRKVESHFSPTKLGKASVASSLAPEESLVVYSEIEKALHSLVLADEVYHTFSG